DAATTAEPAEEPKPILLWRPARHEGRRDHGPRRGRERDGGQREREGGQRGKGQRRDGAPAANESPRPEGERQNRKFGGKPGKPHAKHGGRDNRGDNRGEGRGPKPGQPPRPREERPARMDPDSPF